MQPHLEWLPFTLGAAGLVAITVAAWKARGRWPALPLAWVVYLLLLGAGDRAHPKRATGDRRSLHVSSRRRSVSPHRRGNRRAWTRSLVDDGWSCRSRRFWSASPAATWRQARWWHDSITLWTRAADLDPRNDIATYNLAIALADAGRVEDAAGRYEQTLRLVPDHELARHNLN